MKAIRDALGLSQSELASRLGVTATTVSRWETGRNSITLTIPQVKALDELVDELGIRIKNLPDDLGNRSRIGDRP